ncbi:MAG: hypothetical protein NTY65_09055 [Planctomycetota bacterium]|nr:hypothetical protein [Planctomycetota bacterium]
MPHKRAWVEYIEHRYGTLLERHDGQVDLETLTATQSEIELIKYHMVRHEAFRAGEPILVYKGRFGGYFIVDGHTRARVEWDKGSKTIFAAVYTSSDVAVPEELNRIAMDTGGGRERRIWEVPIVDRVGQGTPAWEKCRQELLDGWRAEMQAHPADPETE